MFLTEKTRDGLIAGGLIFVMGLLLFVLLGHADGLDGIAFTALLVVPLIAYGIASGMVSEFTAPGGWGAKFHEVARAEVEPRPAAGDVDAEFIPLQVIEKGSFAALESKREQLAPDQKLALTLQLGRQGYYTARGVRRYAEILLGQDADLSVIFVNADGRFAASTTGVKLVSAMSDDDVSHRIIEAVEHGDLDHLRAMIALCRTSIPPETSNAQALRSMLEDDVNALIVTAPDGRPLGIVRRDDIITKMLVNLAED